jgi:hypothetical protein
LIGGSTSWCRVQPQNVGLLQGFAALLVGVVVVSLATGVTYARRSIRREREPGAFAVAVGGYGMLAVLCLAGLGLCPHG